MRKLLAILLLGFSTVHAQDVQTTPNLITSGNNHTWTGVQTGTTVGGGFSGGNVPQYNPSTNTIYFGYNQGTAAQTFAINQALQNAGAGIQVGGYNYSWEYLNNSNTGGTLSAAVKLTNPAGTTIEQFNYAMNTIQDGWRTVAGSQNFAQQYNLSDVGNLGISFTGKDARWWAGYYGPQVRNVNLGVRYTVDPCAANPAYSPTCYNYNTISISNNLVPNPGAYAYGGYSIDQSYAINQALGLAGSNVMIHGFQWGYIANTNGPYCSSWFLVCFNTVTPTVTTSVNITDNNNNSIYSVNRTYTNSYNTTNYSYVFPSSRNLATLGRFNFSGTTNDQNAFLGEMWSKALYTPDPCADPLSSPSCPGYAAAYQVQQCTISALFNTSCPGYQVAFFNQQCNINQLYNQSCPGYAAAYLVQQCSLNPLYSTTCSGYSTAYHDQQCSINPLYATDCNGYAAAYKSQQCSANPLYATDCPGYAAAYKSQQCSINALYATDCPGYTQAYFDQQCSLNGLYDRTCPNYNEAYAKKFVLASPTPTAASTTTETTTTASTTVVAQATTTESITTQLSSGISDTTVSSVVTTKATSTSTESSPAAAVKLVAPAQSTTSPTSAVATAAVAEKKQEEKKEEKKDEGSKSNGSNTNSPSGSDNKPSDSPKTARQELAEKRREAAAKEAVAKGKDLANEMGKASDLEAQKAVQNVVIQAMGFTPGFDSYNKAMLPDSRFYAPKTVYGGQVNVDNKAISRRLMGGSDRTHQDMVDSQYNRGN